MKKRPHQSVMLLAENYNNVAKCEHRICPVKRKWAKPKPLLQAKREQEYKDFLLVLLLSLFFLSICQLR